MNIPVPQNLKILACACPFPLYLVGGTVRDFLAGFPNSSPDYDLAAPVPEEEFIAVAERCGFTVKSVYRNTGTVKLKDGRDGDREYEFTRFRSDKYVRGEHTPSEITFTDDMKQDARRRDFCANAIYYDIKAEWIHDPLGGFDDIQNRTLRTVMHANKVFGEDGLRLMRLARLSAELDFSPDGECFAGAKQHCSLIKDIAPERVFAELRAILHAEERHGADNAPYRGLKLLHTTGVLAHILPELTAGEGMRQRNDFHSHDVLEHSMRCVKYAAPDIRFAALLHDVGKPFCYLRDGDYHAHADEGERMAREILTRLKAPKKLTDETAELVRLHMRDFDLRMKPSKVRLAFVKYNAISEKLLALKQADYSACKDVLSPAPSVTKWLGILKQMQKEGVPFTLKELAVNGNDLLQLGLPPEQVGDVLNEMLFFCAQNGRRNVREGLLARAEKMYLSKGNAND